MEQQAYILAKALGQIEQQVGWGSAERWTTADFTNLSEKIQDKTGTLLSPTTLKRVWGRVAYDSSPSATTLDALAQYLDHENWRAYVEQTVRDSEIQDADRNKVRTSKSARLPVLLAITGLVLAVVAFWWSQRSVAAPAGDLAPDAEASDKPLLVKKSESPIDSAAYSFHFRPIAEGIPNSVVFTYDASAAEAEDTVYIQQSWDQRRREIVDPKGDTHTSIYYLPGFYQAKLVVSGQVVKERGLLIPSDGWTVAVMHDPVPVYLPEKEARQNGSLLVTEQQLTQLGIELQPDPPRLIYSSVGEFEDISTDDFQFSTRIHHDYSQGSAACQMTHVLLLLENSVISVPLSRPGCSAELGLFAGGQYFDGKTNDLSAFGAIQDDWLELSVNGEADLLTFYINGQHVFQAERKDQRRKIIGLRYEFMGLGTIDDVRLANGQQTYFEDFSVRMSESRR